MIKINKKRNYNNIICQYSLQEPCSSEFRKLFSQVQISIRKKKNNSTSTTRKKLQFCTLQQRFVLTDAGFVVQWMQCKNMQA